MQKSVDIIVLGATGYTGKFTVKYLASITTVKYLDVKWGIAGRSKDKLQSLVQELDEAGSPIKDLTIIECDIEDEESLRKLLSMTRVVINCTGPNVLLSPHIVRVCIETETHYVDISAEMFHILRLYQDYNQLAEASNVLIVPSCGFASIPVEVGIMYLEKHFEGTLNSVECYTELYLPVKFVPKTLIHNGTWTSTIYVMKTLKQHLDLKQELFPYSVEPEPAALTRSFFFKNNGRTWFPYPGPDPIVTEMSQRYLYEKTGKRPVHMKHYTTVQKFLHFIIVPVMYLYYYLCYFDCFQNLLIKFPRLFALGFVSQKGPTDKTRQNTKYSTTLVGKGWASNSNTKLDPTKIFSVKVSGIDPGYHTTAVAIVSCAITILKESSNIPKGGVIMPGAAFYKTDIVDRLVEGGYTFEVVQ